jgi:hypothetical protein
MAMSSYFSPRWFCSRKKQVDLLGRGKYIFPEEHSKFHAKYNGVFPGEVIPIPVLGSLGTQYMSNPHSFEVWPMEGHEEDICVPRGKKISFTKGVGISCQGSLPRGDLSLGRIFLVEKFPWGVSCLGCLLLKKSFPRGLGNLTEQTLLGMCYALEKDVAKEWMMQLMKMIQNI